MDSSKKTGVRSCNWITFAILTSLIYCILVTVFMLTLYRVVVIQTAKIQTLQAATSNLEARVRKLETSLSAERSEESETSKKNGATNSMNPRNKVSFMIVRNLTKQSPWLLVRILKLCVFTDLQMKAAVRIPYAILCRFQVLEIQREIGDNLKALNFPHQVRWQDFFF